MNPWSLRYDSYEPAREGLREALCTVGNGYFATRGAAPESVADAVHHPGTYLAGYFNRLTDEIAGRTVVNESMVNVPNWLPFTFRIGDGEWFDPDSATLLEYSQELDLRSGVLKRRLRFSDAAGRTTRVLQRRLVHMADRHLAALETTVMAEDWSGTLRFRSAIDGGVANTGVERYRDLGSVHLRPVDSGADTAPDVIHLSAQTTTSHLGIAVAARTRVFDTRGHLVEVDRDLVRREDFVAHEFDVSVTPGEAITSEKVVAVYGSRDRAIHEPGYEARRYVRPAADFPELLATHTLAWNLLWQRFGVEVEGAGDDVQGILNLHVFHLLQTVSPNSVDLDAGIPARGLHGEAYRGHIFWDEVFIFPYLNAHQPEITRGLLEYRYRRLPEARRHARASGFAGALFPWQSGSNGEEETQQMHLNPRSGEWSRDNSHLQRHVDIAIAYNVCRYAEATGDRDFLLHEGAEMMVEITRLLVSLTKFDAKEGRYSIRGVMGPDEYHDCYPDASQPGIDNNAYTNVMTVWCLLRAIEMLDSLSAKERVELEARVSFDAAELERWTDITRKMKVIFHDDGVISQFEGYEKLAEFDWDGYRATYGDIQRLDRILGAEGDTPNRYKLSKQADALMIFFLLSPQEVAEVFERLGYPWSPQAAERTADYYLARTSHGSTLSRVVHAWLLAARDPEQSWALFSEALRSDVDDIQGGTTAEGIHLGVMAGTADLVQRGYAGIELRGDAIWVNPALPEQISRVATSVRYQGHCVSLEVSRSRVIVSSEHDNPGTCRVGVGDRVHDVAPGDSVELEV